ncbi:type I polyketide synthase [Nocardia sp. BMG51109]|uniref:type I polyketide synthase n=1 Tax=Nocardia sp. BMG51109 TaxID=1056816 RepID=UPI0004B90CC4|nr:type I polyketide synthase [Nocardia sp. BMG51109]
MTTDPTYLDVLLERCETLADEVVYRFLRTGDADGPADVLTYRELGLRVRAIAAHLQEHGYQGKKALLVYAPGLEFIESFLGCVAAGVVAVPVPLPYSTDFDRAIRRLGQIVRDADVSVVLTSRGVLDLLRSAGSTFADLGLRNPAVATDDIPTDRSTAWRAPDLSGDSVLFLQYTSGSTSAPKGVMVTHGNLLHNQSSIGAAMGHDDRGNSTVAVSWLPMYHDMGLIGPVLGTIYSRGTAVLLSPLHFVQRPERWVDAISRFRATNSGGPNFAYEITARRATAELIERLDLSSWRVAFCGAEPVRAATVRRFGDTFAESGFRRTAFQPVYGLAEATLIVSAAPLGLEPTIETIPAAPGAGADREIVGAGRPVPGTTVVVADAATGAACDDGREGEIWVSGGSVSPGYVGGPDADAGVFGSTLADGRTGFLRTGDLGLFRDGELFVTGRLKDLLIVDGRNLHPQDLEQSVELAHDNIRRGGVAAFSVDAGGTEGIVIVAEVRAANPEALEAAAHAVRQRISTDHAVRLHDIVLIAARSIFKTSSGKIQRQACRSAYLEGTLPDVLAVESDSVPAAADDRAPGQSSHVARRSAGAADMELLLRDIVATQCGLAESEVTPDRPLAELGLGSRRLVEIIGAVSERLSRPLDPGLIFEHSTIRSLAEALAGDRIEPADPVGGRGGDEPIAVLSMACRFPGDTVTPEQFWQLLAEGRDVVGEVPADRWDLAPEGLRGGFLSDVKTFDAAFFGISPREAEAMDPHQRLLLQLGWEAMERAGIVPKDLEGTRTGVYIGMFGGQYLAGLELDRLDGYVATGTATSVASGRLAYTFGLHGPALTVDTACSSALVSLHLAVQALRRGECDAALVGSATLLLTAGAHVEFGQLGVLSPTGRCAPFAADADGAVWSEGCGMILLKRLDDAVRDGDPVLAVIRGSAVNQDGRSQGLSAPNGRAQDEVIAAALRDAGLEHSDVDYVEAHGTATTLGDRIEARSLDRVFGDRDRGAPGLRIGSVKSNIGHTQASAGMAGLIKSILALRHDTIPASVHAERPADDLEGAGLELIAAARPWQRDPRRVRTAGVSAFGLSGTNAHVVLQESPITADIATAPQDGSRPHLPIPLSARSAPSLRALAAKMRDHLTEQPELDIRDVATTLASHRAHLEERAVVIARDRAELLGGLTALADSGTASHVARASDVRAASGRIAFVFPGQGSQWSGMARDMYERSEVFRREFDRCDTAFHRYLGWSVADRLTAAEDRDMFQRDEVVQPLLFCVMVSLAAVWRHNGIHPDAVIGHSQGEIAAAYVAGVLTLSDAACIVARRSSALSLVPADGRMLLVGAPLDDIEARIEEIGADRISIAAVNSVRSIVLSGEAGALDDLAARFERDGVFVRKLPVRYASHSRFMDPLEEVLRRDLADIRPGAGDVEIAWYSTVSGEPMAGGSATADYWFRNIRATVRFAAGVERMIADGVRFFVEVGPHPVLSADLESLGDVFDTAPVVRHSLRRDEDGMRCMAESLAGLHLAGIPVDWSRALPRGRRVDLPTYAFEGRRYWLEVRGESSVRRHGLGVSDHPLVSVVIPQPSGGVVLAGRVSVADHPWLADHALAGVVLVPGAGMVEMTLRAGAEVECSAVREVILQAPMIVPDGGALQVQVEVSGPRADGSREATIHSRRENDPGQWICHARAELGPGASLRAAGTPEPWPPAAATAVDVDEFYRQLAARGYEYGPALRRVRRLWRLGERVFSEVALDESARDADGYRLHPTLLDAVVQTIGATGIETADGVVPLPFAWTGVSAAPAGATTWRAEVTPTGSGEYGIRIADADGHEFAVIDVLRLHDASLDDLARTAGTARQALYSLDWEPAPAPSHTGEVAWVEVVTPEDTSSAGDEQPVLILRHAGVTEDRTWPARLRAETMRAAACVQSWLARESSRRLVVVTCRATAAGPRDDVDDLLHAPLWGLLRSAQNENPGRIVLVDIDDTAQLDRAIAAATTSAAAHLAIRRDRVLTQRLTAEAPAPITGSERVLDADWELTIGDRGTLDGENFVATSRSGSRTALSPGQVRVAVRATGVNFRDVVTTLGMVSDQAALIGSEGAGVVVEVAEDVREFAIGDRVLGVIPAVGSIAVTDHRLLVPVPESWSFAQAASVPVAFLTAWYALARLADLRPGQKLLVHAASGGVGMAAVQIGQLLGAEVFATASTGKWAAVREWGLTDDRIADSRTLDFEAKFSRDVDGRAMDVVLGSLSGEFVDASLRLASPGGLYIEMGKTDIRESAGAGYTAFTLGAVDPAVIAEMLADVMTRFATGELRLIPTVATDVRQIPAVFRDMRQAKHIGKNVLTIPVPIDRASTALIVGGTGQIGRLLARHLVTRYGLRHILLLSRTGGTAAGTDSLRSELAELGATVDIRRCDAADREQLAEAIASVPAEHPLTTVVHAAGALDDVTFTALEPRHLDAVFGSKVDVAWNLHELTADLDLALFVVFSSVAGKFGSPGQANYAAANAFVDALIQYRSVRGLPGTAIAWGLWALDGGMTGHLTESDRKRLRRAGIVALSADEGLDLFDAAVAAAQSAPIAARLDLQHAAPSDTRTRPPAHRTETSEAGAPSGADLARALSGSDAAARRATVLSVVTTQAAATLGYSVSDEVRVTSTFRDLGFDSLSAVDFRNRLQNATGVRLPVTVVFDYPTPQDLAEYLCETLAPESASPAVASSAAPAGPDSDLVAIVGVGCRFPGGVSSPEEFWDVVAGERDVISEFPSDRGWDVDGVFDPVPGTPGRSYVREGGFVDGAGEFDAGFFGISPREALAMDPQQRLLLEVSWEALESAGIDPRSLKGTDTGVYTGVLGTSNYSADGTAPTPDMDGYRLTGNTISVVSGRVAYTLGLEGPAVSVDTACSSSLVALHLGAQGLRSGECSLALVGGVTVMATPSGFVEFSQLRGLAADARSKVFGDDADGFVPSEGAGVLVVERLSDALRLGHRVWGVVRGSAVNQDGASNGLSAPSGVAQQRVIRAALAKAGVAAEDVDAVEAHGTGTRLGDPIEVHALQATYGRNRSEPLWLGSVKSNMGHASAAAGVAGVIKMVMALRHDTLPATLHADRPSAQVDWAEGGVEVLTSSRPWPRAAGRVRRAGVSGFGISGTNAHVIVEEAPDALTPEREPAAAGPIPVVGAVPWMVSGRSANVVARQAERWVARIAGDPAPRPVDVGVSVAARSVFEHRAVVVGADRAALTAGLRALAEGGRSDNVVSGRAGVAGKTVLVFPGQGSQWARMGVELLDSSPVFAEYLGRCEQALAGLVDWRLTDVLRGAAGAPGLDRVDVVQPALFSVLVSLARVWESLGVTADGVIGHSQGEIAAAHIAGALSLDDALRIVTYRSSAITRIAGQGAMATIALAAETIRDRITERGDDIDIAATNSPVSTVIAGGVDAVTALVADYEAAGVRARIIPVDYASHSRSVESLRRELNALSENRSGASAVTFYSSTVGGAVDTAGFDDQYWYRNLRETVRFDAAVRAAFADGARYFVEVSPHPVLTVALEEIFDAAGERESVYIGETLRRDDGGGARVLLSAAGVFCAGGPVDWSRCFAGTDARPIDLPTYAFERQRYWLEARGTASARRHGLDAADHPLVTAVIPQPVSGGVTLSGRISLGEHPWLADHAVAGTALLPGTALLELALRAGAEVGCPAVRELILRAPMVIPDRAALQLQVVVEGSGGDRSASIYSRREGDDGGWVLHAQAELAAAVDIPAQAEPEKWPPRGVEPVDIDEFYGQLADRGIEYGPAFRRVRGLWRRGEQVYSEIGPESGAAESGYELDPVLLDAVVQTIGASGFEVPAGSVPQPFAWEGVSARPAATAVWRATVKPIGTSEFDIRIADDGGSEFAAITALRLHTASLEDIARATGASDRLLHTLDWEPLGHRPAPRPDTEFDIVRIDHATGYAPHIFGDDTTRAVIVDIAIEADPGVDLVHTLAESVLTTIRSRPAEQSRLTILTRGAVLVPGDDTIEPAAAALWGLVRAAQNESPGRFTLLDTDGSLDPAQVARYAEPLVAVRRGRIHVPRIQRLDVPRSPLPWGDDHGTVLIVGGTGGLGAVVARHMVAEHGVRRLILASRSGPSASGADRLEAELRESGAAVRIVACDAADRDELAQLIDSIPAETPLTAVVSAAGQVADGTVDTLTPEQLHTVLRAKVDVAWNLHTLTERLGVKTFILFSSAAGTLGSPGQANYAAANAYLDAFAQYRRHRGLPGLSVAWGIWAQDTGGMSGRLSGANVSRIGRSGLSQLPREVGLDIFDRVAGSDRPFLLAASFDADHIARVTDTPGLFDRLVRRDRRAAAASAATGSDLLERLAAMDLQHQQDALLAEIQTHAAEILGYESRLAVVPDTAFKDLGFDSLTAVEFRNRLQAIVDLRLPVSTIFDHPSPLRLAQHVMSVLRDRYPEKYGRNENEEAPQEPGRSGAAPADGASAVTAEEIADMELDALINLAERG